MDDVKTTGGPEERPSFLQNGRVAIDVDQVLAMYGSTRIEADLMRAEIGRLENVVVGLTAMLRNAEQEVETVRGAGVPAEPPRSEEAGDATVGA